VSVGSHSDPETRPRVMDLAAEIGRLIIGLAKKLG
jgi:hypothetical protein